MLITSAGLGLSGQFGPLTVAAAEEVSAPGQPNGKEGRTNELQKIIETQQEILRSVNRLRDETEVAKQRNAEALQNLRDETAAAMQRTREELSRDTGALGRVLAHQFGNQVDTLQQMNRSTVITFSVLAGLGLVSLLAVSLVLWRVLRQITEPGWAQTQVRVGPGEARAALVEDQSNALTGVSGEPEGTTVLASLHKLERLEKRILQLESEAAPGRGRENGGEPRPESAQSAAGARTIRDIAKTDSAEVRESLDRGQALLKSGSPQEALEHFLRAIRAGPGTAEAYLRKGSALEQLGRLNDALAAYDEAIAADPTLNSAYLRKGGLCNRLGRLDEAFQSFERVLQTLDRPTRS